MAATRTAPRQPTRGPRAPSVSPPSAAAATARDTTDCAHSPAVAPSMTRSRAETVADVFKVLADPSRVLILEALREAGELCVLHLADSVGMSQSAVSHNLRLLRQAGLVARRRDGRLVYYRPDDDHVTGLVGLCAEHVAHRDGRAGGGVAADSASRDREGTTTRPDGATPLKEASRA